MKRLFFYLDVADEDLPLLSDDATRALGKDVVLDAQNDYYGPHKLTPVPELTREVAPIDGTTTKIRLTFVGEIEDAPDEIDMMREQIGEAFEAANAMWSFDTTLVSIEPT